MDSNEIPACVASVLLNHGAEHHVLGWAKHGVTGAKVVFLDVGGKRLVLKYGNPSRVSISTQVQNRAFLSRYLERRLPRVIGYQEYDGGQAMLMEAIEGPTLHEAVVSELFTEATLAQFVINILKDFRTMWLASRTANYGELTRDPQRRAAAVKDFVEQILFGLRVSTDDCLMVNGEAVGSARELLPLLMLYRRPPSAVHCHSDLKPDNFVLRGEEEWFLVDWEWAGIHDWKLSLSQLLGWWRLNATSLPSMPSLIRTHGFVELNYELQDSSSMRTVEKICWEHAEQFALEMREPEGWRDELQRLLAVLFLGDLRFLPQRERQSFMLPALGEGLRILKGLKNI